MSRHHFSERILRGFILSDDALFEIRQLLERRQKTKFSDGLSPEAKLALQQMREDSRVRFNEDSEGTSAGEECPDDTTGRRSVQRNNKTPRKSGKDKSRRQISFTDSPRGNQKGVKLNSESKDIINTTWKGNDVTPMESVGERDLVVTDSSEKVNAVDKCREWVAVNGVEATSGT